MSIKNDLFQFLWSDVKLNDFEEWLFKQDSEDFEKMIGKDNYLDIISNDFSKMSPDKIKQMIYDKFNSDLKNDCNKFFIERYLVLIGICKTSKALDYYSNNLRDWEISVGQKYEIIEIIKSSNNNDNHKQYVRYVDRENNLYPSGLIPIDLFDINLDKISELYLVRLTEDIIEIMPKDWSDDFYKPTQYSFWEDFYNNDKKAIKKYYETLDKLGINNAWHHGI